MTKGKLAVIKIMHFANFTETSDHLDTVLSLFLGTGEGLCEWVALKLSFNSLCSFNQLPLIILC